MKVGEVYFIRERDRIDGGNSSYVKIGIVQDASSSDSQKRLHTHQTANPRDLELHHVTQTPGPYRVERFLHQRFGPKRIRSEWFRFTDVDLAEAVQTAERMAAEAFIYIPIMKKAEELKTVTSTPDKIDATDESTQWITALSVATTAVKHCKAMSTAYAQVVAELPPEDRAQAELEELVITEHRINKTFDQVQFAEKYPELLKAYNVTTTPVKGSFRPILLDVDLAEAARELFDFCSSFQEACDQHRRGELPFGDLFDLHQILVQFRGAYSWDEEVADANLRVICGASAGIEGQATWKRAAKPTTELDVVRLESEHPDEYNEFVRVTVTKHVKRERRARLQATRSS